MPDPYLLKICIIGTPNELKTKMNRNFCGYQPNTLLKTGVEILTKEIRVAGNFVKLILVDTAGQEFFGKLRPSYYRGASAAIITFAKEDRGSFKAVKDWYKEFKKQIPKSSVPITLVGFITDSEAVTTEEGQNLAEELGISYYETKPTNRRIMAEVCQDLALKIINKVCEGYKK